MPRIFLQPVVICVFVFLSSPIAAQDVAVAPPIQALRSLYDNNPAFRANIDRAFANMKDPAPNTRELWPSPTAANPWRGKFLDSSESIASISKPD